MVLEVFNYAFNLILAALSSWVSFGSLWFSRNRSISFIVEFVRLELKKSVYFYGDFQFVAYNPYPEASIIEIKIFLSPHMHEPSSWSSRQTYKETG